MRRILPWVGLIVSGCGSRAEVVADDAGIDAAAAPVPAASSSSDRGPSGSTGAYVTVDASTSDGTVDTATPLAPGDEVPSTPPTCTVTQTGASWRIWLDDQQRLLVEAFDASGTRVRTTTRRYDALGRLVRHTVTHHAPDDECFDYSAGSFVRNVCGTASVLYGYQVDDHDRVIGSPPTTWIRDLDGRVVGSTVAADGTHAPSTTTLLFDTAGRVMTLDEVQRAAAYVSHVGFVWTETPNGFTVGFAAGSHVRQPKLTCRYTFDSDDRLITAACGDDSGWTGNTWSYDPSGELAVVGDGIPSVQRHSAGCPQPLGRAAIGRWLFVHTLDPDPRLRPIEGLVAPVELTVDRYTVPM